MKRLIALLLLLFLPIGITSCKSEAREIPCADIIVIYESAGYYVEHIGHYEEDEYFYRCRIIVQSDESSPDRAYITTYHTEAAAKEAAKADKYSLAKWIIIAMFGEGRWLKSGYYGCIEYSSYNNKLLKPLKKILR